MARSNHKDQGGKRHDELMPDVSAEEDASNETSAVEYEIHRVCDEIDKAGEKPTYKGIRERRGFGSYSTIQRYLNTWIPQDRAPPIDVPEPLVRLGSTLTAAVWGEAVKIGRGEFADMAQRFDQSEAELRLAVQHAEDDCAAHLGEAERLREALSKAEMRTAEQRTAIEALRLEVAQLKGKIEGLTGKFGADLAADLNGLYNQT